MSGCPQKLETPGREVGIPENQETCVSSNSSLLATDLSQVPGGSLPGSIGRKRFPSPDRSVPPRKRKAAVEDVIDMNNIQHISYYFENGLRKVVPYYYTWTSHAKGRWLGQTLEQVFNAEFFAVSDEVVGSRVAGKHLDVFVNGKRVDLQYKIKNGDFIANYVHRHEMPVTGAPLKIVAETDDLLVLDKPSSIPVHPCGRYRMNSVQFILAREHGLNNLRIVHRLDRLTSGLLIFAKTLAVSQGVHDQMVDRSVHKEYISRVKGRFPDANITCTDPIDCINLRTGFNQVRDTGRQCVTSFDLLAYEEASNTSIVHCKPVTGRTHQIRVHLQHIGFPIANDPIYGGTPVDDTEKDRNSRQPTDLDNDDPDQLKRCKYRVLDELPKSNSPWSRDPLCKECWLQFEDPAPESLRIDLHAWKYEGPGWKFETELPEWAAAAAPVVAAKASALAALEKVSTDSLPVAGNNDCANVLLKCEAIL